MHWSSTTPLFHRTCLVVAAFPQAFRWSGGKVLFASGSPFDPITSGGVTYVPAQANNAYIFPAVGHAAVLLSSGSIEEDVFLVAAEALAEMSPAAQLQRGRLFPPFADITRVSARLTARLIDRAVQAGEAPRPVGAAAFASTEAFVTSKMWRVGQLSAL